MNSSAILHEGQIFAMSFMGAMLLTGISLKMAKGKKSSNIGSINK